MSAYFQIAKLRLLTSLTYRFDVFTGIATNLVLMTATVFLWQTAFQGVNQVAGVEQEQMVTYAILSSVLGAVFVSNVQNNITDRIRQGDIAVDFMRPINPLFAWLADDIGAAIGSLALRIIPLLLFAVIFFRIPWPASINAFLLFIPCSVLSFAILWLLGALTGLISFWTMELGHMGAVKDAIVRILSGGLVPLWFFPLWAQKISVFLPFQYTFQMPLAIYIGRTPTRQALPVMLLQMVWVVLLAGLVSLVWRQGHKRVLVQGG